MKLCGPPMMSCVPVLFLLMASAVDSSKHFGGGSISFEIHEDLPDPTKIRVHLDVLTGWVLGKGPCGPNCSMYDVGSPTTDRRKSVQKDVNLGPDYFGGWGSSGRLGVVTFTDRIHSEVAEKVVAVNELDMWEQEWMQADFVISRMDTDLFLKGLFWHNVTFQGNDLAWYIQAQIHVGIRNDTHLPNRSPKVLFRPIYRVRLDAISEITLTAMDPDGDVIKCLKPFYQEYRGFYLSDPLIQHNVQLLENCSIIINASRSAGFTNDVWFIYVVSMRDYNIQPLQLPETQLFLPYSFSLSTVPIQFLVHVVADLDMPEFIKPTFEKGHEFVVFIGASWSTSVYAKPAQGRTIATFEVQTRSGEKIETTGPFDVTTAPGAKSISLFWVPNKRDVGPHIVCVRAVDNTGMDSQTDERCFKISVEDKRFTRCGTGGDDRSPFFINLPGGNEENTLICPRMATCVFPVIVHSNEILDRIQELSESDQFSKGNITATGHTDEYSMDVQFSHGSHGQIKICLKAYSMSGKTSPVSCFNATILGPDPCISKPCKNGVCVRGMIDTTSFTCDCRSQYIFGKDCSKVLDVCASSPCQNDAFCRSFPTWNKYRCRCRPGTAGINCEYKIDTCLQDDCGSTSYHGICINNGTGSSCQCYPRYSGQDCSSDACPGLLPGDECPVSANSPCVHNNCNNNGICQDDGSCVCQLGYTGPVCANVAHTTSSSLAFVEPTIKEGNLLVCYFSNNQTQPCTFRVFVSSSSGSAPNVTLSRGSGTLSLDSRVGAVLQETHTGRPNTFMADIIVEGTKAYGRNQICVAAVDSNDIALRCVEVNFKTDPTTSNYTREYKQNARIRFVDPSPLSDSKFSCNVNQSCYLMLYTEKLGPQCLNIPTPRPEFTVYDPVTSSQCITEISYRFVKEGEYFVCIQSELQFGEDRCYTFFIYNGNDPCDPSPCMNRGMCGRRYLQSYCICPEGMTGETCAKDAQAGL